MKVIIQFSIFLLLLSAMGIYLGGCVHDPVIVLVSPKDTSSNPIDTSNSKDTTTNPCDPSIIYFDNQVLPLLLSGCALAGCHAPNSGKDGVVLNSFDNVVKTGGIKAFNPGGSKLYRAVTTGDSGDRMPPPPMNSLSADQKKIISDWILQGATRQTCDQPKTCDTLAVRFSSVILPIINNNCKVCHSGTTPSGNISLSNYSEIRNYAINGKLACVINWNAGCVKMPSGGQKLDACTINKIEAWIHQGIQNN